MEWHTWVKAHLNTISDLSSRLSGIREIINNGDAGRFQTDFTAFLQEYIASYLVPHQKEKVYQALIFMLFFVLFGDEYNVRMEQDSGFGRSDIIVHPVNPQRSLAFVIELKSVSPYWKDKKGKRSLKTPKRRENGLEKAKTEALRQLEDRQYRAGVPLHAEMVHEFAFVFCGKFCVAAVRTLRRNDKREWVQDAEKSTGVAEHMFDTVTGEEGEEEEEEEEDERDDEAEMRDQDDTMASITAASPVPSPSKRTLTPPPREATRKRRATPRKPAGGQ